MSETKELQVLVDESGLDSTKARILMDNFSDAFDKAAEWELQAQQLVVTNAFQVSIQRMAKVLRLEIRKVRLEVENTRKSLKEQALREGKAIDGIANVLKALMVPLEEHLDKQENFIKYENQALAEQARIEADRLLAEKIESERVAEEKRIADQAAENTRLKLEAEAREKAAEAERAEAARKRALEEARAAAERKAALALLAEEREAAAEQQRQADAALQKERDDAAAKADAAQKESDAKAAEAVRVADEKARLEEEERERVRIKEQGQLNANLKDAVLKAARDKQAAIEEAEKKAGIEAEEREREHQEELRISNENAEKELAKSRQVKCPQCGTQFDSAEHKYTNEAIHNELFGSEGA